MTDSDISMLVITGLVAMTVIAALLILHDTFSPEARRVRHRLEKIQGRTNPVSAGAEVASVSVKRDELGGNKTIERVFTRFVPQPKNLRTRLNRTGREITISSYLIASVVVWVIAGGLAAVYGGLPWSVSGLVGFCLGLALPHLAISRMIAKRQRKFLDQFPESLDLIVRGLKSGLPVTESLQTVGREVPDPVGTEFRQITDEIQLGQTMEGAMADSAKRVAVTEMNFFVTTLSIQRETGGNLGETLENLADILRRRRQMKLKIRATSSEARASALIIGVMPFVVSGILSVLNPDYLSVLFEDPRGHVMVAAGLTFMALGGIVMAKMVRFDI